MPRPMLAGQPVDSPFTIKVVESDSSDYTHYTDKGCEISPSCLSCPLPVCKDDIPLYTQLSNYWRASTVLEAIETGDYLHTIASKRFQMTRPNKGYDFDQDFLDTYGNHPFLGKLWNGGYRPKYGRGKPIVELTVDSTVEHVTT